MSKHTLFVNSHKLVQCVECGIAGAYPEANNLPHILIRFPRDLSKAGWSDDCSVVKKQLDYSYKGYPRPAFVAVIYNYLENLKDWGAEDETAIFSGMNCAACGAPATRYCAYAGQLVCGAALCANCDHSQSCVFAKKEGADVASPGENY